MRAIVALVGPEDRVFENVMGIRTDAETLILWIDYEEISPDGKQTTLKTADFGVWFKLEVQPVSSIQTGPPQDIPGETK